MQRISRRIFKEYFGRGSRASVSRDLCHPAAKPKSKKVICLMLFWPAGPLKLTQKANGEERNRISHAGISSLGNWVGERRW